MARRRPAPAPIPLAAPTLAWLRERFGSPTPAQVQAWAAIARGEDTLVVAPTGSGKTLAAFLHAIDRLVAQPRPVDPLRRCRVLYVSPLKALAVDVERNLRDPLAGVVRARSADGLESTPISVGLRTGDTPPAERARQRRRPPDVWITTPESLFLLLTSAARDGLRAVDTVIVDEVHALAGTKRGAHLAISLERLDALLPRPARRIALSATVAPVDVVAGFVRSGRPATIVAPPLDKQWRIRIEVPVEDLADIGASAPQSADDPVARSSIWPHAYERIVDLVEQHRSTLVFVNSRGAAERVTASINAIAADRGGGSADPPLARAHHGSVSRAEREGIETDLKSGRLRAVVATSSLELGIDMGSVDLVVQVQTPPSVASGLQRIGRAGHQVGAVSTAVVVPKSRGDLLTAVVVADRMRQGLIEPVRIPRNPLDVLVQQVVAAVAMDDWPVADLLALVRRTASFADLSDSVFAACLDLASGRYPSDEFAHLRPRVVWDRHRGVLTARPGAKRLAVTSGGTIPDRGLFPVFRTGSGAGRRVGELDEEMVYESRVGDVIALGASSWRIDQINHDRVLVTPAPGRPGRPPFWHGDTLGRPAELGRAIGAFVRAADGTGAPAIGDRDDLDERAAANLSAYLRDQRAATGALPSDRTVVVERFRDELGDWRIVVHTPFGGCVHAPWALAIGARLRDRTGIDAAVMSADDGIVLRLPDTEDETSTRVVLDAIAVDPSEIDALVTAEVGGSALFAARFRECAARALLLPRLRPDRRMPLWQQRQRAAQLLAVASGHGSFPIVLEAMRECLQDVYDLPALHEVLSRIADGQIDVHDCVTDHPSPFAQSLLFDYVTTFLYEADAPLAERRAQALTVDSALLADLLGTPELRDLLDPQVLAEIEAELQRHTPATAIGSAEELADALRVLGPMSASAAVARGAEPGWLDDLVAGGRAYPVVVAGVARVAAIEDAGRLRDALGATAISAAVDPIPAAHLLPVADPLGDVVGRYARTHAPFPPNAAAADLGLPVAAVVEVLDRLVGTGRIVRGAFWPSGTTTEYVDAEVLRRIRRRTVARLREQVEPVPPTRFAAFLPHWQHVVPQGARAGRHGADAAYDVVAQLAGAALPVGTWVDSVFPARLADAHEAVLDELVAAGDVVWWGVARPTDGDGILALAPADRADALRAVRARAEPTGEVHRRIVAALTDGGAQFFRSLCERLDRDEPVVDLVVLDALWDLVWSGWVANDSWAAVRARVRGRATARPAAAGAPVRRARYRPAARTGRADAAGRWHLLPPAREEPQAALVAVLTALVDRVGVVTRSSVADLGLPGGFATAYPVLAALADAGACQRVYAIEHLGAAQFARPATIDRLRAPHPGVVALAATDPANAYGLAVPWPAAPTGHRPARRAGAGVVLVDGELVVYLERGGGSAIVWAVERDVRAAALAALPVAAARAGCPRMILTRVNGAPLDPEWIQALAAAGFRRTPRGMRVDHPPRP